VVQLSSGSTTFVRINFDQTKYVRKILIQQILMNLNVIQIKLKLFVQNVLEQKFLGQNFLEQKIFEQML
jgi:hypothetical protein